MRSELFSLYKHTTMFNQMAKLATTTNKSYQNIYKLAKKMLRIVYKVTSNTLVIACMGNTFVSMVGYPASVNGASMKPALNDVSSSQLSISWFGLDLDWVFINCWAAKHHELHRGEVVAMVSPKDPSDYIIKRVIAVEGDVISNKRYFFPPLTLAKGSCWVEGDNRETSVDSNSTYGPVSQGLIFGKATHIIWPPGRWGQIKSEIPNVQGRKIENILGGQNIKISER